MNEQSALFASALRTSLIVIMLLGLPLIGFLVYLNIKKTHTPPAEINTPLPEGGNEESPRSTVSKAGSLN